MIAVVGGGMAGLAAAYRLQERGHEVRVFEAAEDLGGLAVTYGTAGDPIEKFYHHLSANEETIVGLADDLGLGDAVEWRYKSDAFYVDGVVHPMDTIWEIAAYPDLSLYDKFRLGMLTLGVDVRGGIPEVGAYEEFTAFEDVPVKEFLVEHTTRRVYERFWKPLLDAKFGSRAEDVSAAWLLGRIQFRGERDLLRGEQLGYVEGSFARLIEALIDAVGREHIETGARVTDIGVEGGSVESVTVEAGDAEVHDADAVVVATMPNVLESLTGYACEIDFQGTVCAVVSYPEALTDAYWVNFVDEAPFGVLLEHTNFVPPGRYGGEHLLYLASYVQDPGEELWGMDDEEVREHWLSGLADRFPAFDPEAVNWTEVARNPRTAPIYERGYLDMVVPYDLGDAVAEGVYYAGMASRAQYPERSLNGAVEAGFACADLLGEG
ncbi:MAG: NAD(P)/FAD-dependent oxidoreductase [Halobacteriales archaeon]